MVPYNWISLEASHQLNPALGILERFKFNR